MKILKYKNIWVLCFDLEALIYSRLTAVMIFNVIRNSQLSPLDTYQNTAQSQILFSSLDEIHCSIWVPGWGAEYNNL